jgi:penicillin-binding protein 1C
MRAPSPAARRAAFVAALTLVVTLVACRALIASGALIDRARFAHPDDSVVVVDRTGRTLRLARVDGADRRWVRLSDVSPNLIAAVIATEDGDFHGHHGVDWRAVFRSMARNVVPGNRWSGASTITQQLVKRVYGRRGLWSKPVEALRAMSLERVLSKDEILEQYLNRLPFGDGIEGVERASVSYFGHSAATMTVAEAALLAGVPQAPSATEPRRHLGRALSRRGYVLDRMLARGVIDRASWEVARNEHPAIATEGPRPWEAPRAVDHALGLLRRGEAQREGVTLRTSIDLPLQTQVESLLRAGVSRFATRGARNGAAIVVANATGEVLAYVGAARDGSTDAGGALDLLRARRQPGSTLKPFVYELLFERGGSPATVLDDVALPMRGAHGATFEARDYDGRERGPVRARVALAASLNLAALDATGRVGSDRVVQRLRALGVRVPDDAAHYGAAVVLGGADVSALELARAYVTLARGGAAVPLQFTPVSNTRGVPVMHPDAASLAWDVLSDPVARADAFGHDLRELAGDQPFALKTGTSSNWRDAWAAVATRRVTVVVWLGDPSGAAMRSVSGFEASAPIAARILAAAERLEARIEPVSPPDVHLVEGAVCAWTGLRAGPRCHHLVRERFTREGIPEETCDAHDASGRDVLGARYAAWFGRQHPAGVVLDEGHATAVAATDAVVVSEPRDGAQWLLDAAREAPDVRLRATLRGVTTREVTWEVDGVALASDRWTATAGTHHVVAVRGSTRSAPSVVTVRVASARDVSLRAALTP